MEAGFVIDRHAWGKVAEQLIASKLSQSGVFSQFVAEKLLTRTPAQIEDLNNILEHYLTNNRPLYDFLISGYSSRVLNHIENPTTTFETIQSDNYLSVLEPIHPLRTAEKIATIFNNRMEEYALCSRPLSDYARHAEPHPIELKYRQTFDVTAQFRKYRQYSKTLIIADPYLFHQKSAIDLRAFIDAFIKKPTHTRITLLTSDFRDEKQPETDLSPFQGLNCEIRFVNQSIIKQELHDRWVIADWTAFNVGAGMDSFITGKVKKRTTIQVHPRLASPQAYEEQRKHHEWLMDDKNSRIYQKISGLKKII